MRCIQLYEAHHIAPEQIAAVRLRVAPLVKDLCNQTGITKGLQGKFSVYHGAAVGLVRGRAGVQEYTDAAVNDPAVKRVRELTEAVGDASVTEDQAHVAVQTTDGRRVEIFVTESLGNLKRPLTDAQLEAKFRDQAMVNVPASVADALIDACWRIDTLDGVGSLVELSKRGLRAPGSR